MGGKGACVCLCVCVCDVRGEGAVKELSRTVVENEGGKEDANAFGESNATHKARAQTASRNRRSTGAYRRSAASTVRHTGKPGSPSWFHTPLTTCCASRQCVFTVFILFRFLRVCVRARVYPYVRAFDLQNFRRQSPQLWGPINERHFSEKG